MDSESALKPYAVKGQTLEFRLSPDERPDGMEDDDPEARDSSPKVQRRVRLGWLKYVCSYGHRAAGQWSVRTPMARITSGGVSPGRSRTSARSARGASVSANPPAPSS